MGEDITAIPVWLATGGGSAPLPEPTPEPEPSSGQEIVIADDATEIDAYEFYGNETHGAIVIPASVKNIGRWALAACKGVSEVEIPTSVTNVGAYAFSNNRALTNVVMHAGLTTIQSAAFLNTGLRDVVIPDSVVSVGNCVFEYCYSLTNAVVGESVSEMGQWVFDRCTNLASVVFRGDAPALESDADIYRSTKASLVTYVPRGSTGWGVSIPGVWQGRRIAYVGEAPLPMWVVVLDAQGGNVAETTLYVVDGAAVGSLPRPTRSGYTFAGWFTAASGGTQVTDSTMVRSSVTYYAHWTLMPTPTPMPTPEPTPAPEPVAEAPVLWTDAPADAVMATAAMTYDGYLYNKDKEIIGTIPVKVGKPNRKTGLASVKATVVGPDGKKKSLKAEEKGKAAVASDDPTEVELVGGEACTVTLGAKGMSGTYGNYAIDGALNVFASKDAADKETAKAVLGKWQGAVNVAWRLAGDGAPYQTLSVNIANKGKAKVSGTLADGVKVTANGQLLVGEEWCCVPVLVTKKAQLAFALWLPLNGSPNATGGTPVVPVAVGLGEDVKVGKPGTLKAGAAFRLGAALGDAQFADYLPDGVAITVANGRWTLPKAGKVAYLRGTTDVDEAKAGENPSALKLTYKAKDGTFKGTFKAYADANGKPKATTVNVAGVLVGGVGYGAATVKKAGGVAVTIE